MSKRLGTISVSKPFFLLFCLPNCLRITVRKKLLIRILYFKTEPVSYILDSFFLWSSSGISNSKWISIEVLNGCYKLFHPNRWWFKQDYRKFFCLWVFTYFFKYLIFSEISVFTSHKIQLIILYKDTGKRILTIFFIKQANICYDFTKIF